MIEWYKSTEALGKYLRLRIVRKEILMINRIVLTNEQAVTTIQNGEFSEDILRSGKVVIVVLSQDWCPQWIHMKRWIYQLETDTKIQAYELLYNNIPAFHKFKHFKETQWNNYQIPYVRYYMDGKLFHESNYVNEKTFMSIITMSN